MTRVIGIPVSDLLKMVGNKAFGFGLTFFPETDGANGVIQSGSEDKPVWLPAGPFNSKGGGTVIEHIEVRNRSGKVIINNSKVYDLAGFIAVKAPIINDPVEPKNSGRSMKDVVAARAAQYANLI